MDWCTGCARDHDQCICEPDTPELRAEIMAQLIANGLDPEKPLGPQLGLDTPAGLARVTTHFAAQGILPDRLVVQADGTVEREPEDIH